jgi:hypothetical protein
MRPEGLDELNNILNYRVLHPVARNINCIIIYSE